MKRLILTPIYLLVFTVACCAADGQEKKAGNGELAPKLNEETLERIQRTEGGMKALLDKMITIAVEIDPALKEKPEKQQARMTLKGLDRYAQHNELFRTILAEYRHLEDRAEELRNPQKRAKGKRWITTDYPRVDVASIGKPVLPGAIRQKPWSWERIHRYIAIYKTGPYTEDDAKTIANFDMIQLGSTAKHEWDFAKNLKKYNPDMICIGYRNVTIWHETFDSDLFRDHPDWFLKNYLTGKYETMAPTGYAANKPLFDLRVPEMRDWWIEDIGSQCETEGFDGVLIDALAKIFMNYRPVRRSIGDAPQNKTQYSNLFVNQVLQRNIRENGEKGLIVANALRSGYEDCLKSYADALFHGSYMEWIESPSSANYEELLSRLMDTCIQIGKDPGDKFLCFQFHAGYPPPPKANVDEVENGIPASTVMPDLGQHFDDKGKTDEEILREMREAFPYKLAIFLICANKYSYMGYQSSHWADELQERWYPQYPEHKKRIGKPLGHAVKKGKYYYEREFEGVSVKLNIETRQAVLDWK
ncbi:MAG: hypothetical protein HN341_05930 [Verrucomicrobia bacterium]|jgi:hypothetical protein|nr:hypothetical protein [Verrucomicrobiota bacterium]